MWTLAGLNWWSWGAPAVVPPSGPLNLASRYRMGYRNNYVTAVLLIGLLLL